MIEVFSGVLLMCGAFFMLIAAIGVVKFNDVYARMHAVTKAASLGLVLMLAAVVIHYPISVVWIEALMVLLFVLLTTPVGMHMIARVAYQMDVPKGMPYVVDEMRHRFFDDTL